MFEPPFIYYNNVEILFDNGVFIPRNLDVKTELLMK